jgi:hypothetical protein
VEEGEQTEDDTNLNKKLKTKNPQVSAINNP